MNAFKKAVAAAILATSTVWAPLPLAHAAEPSPLPQPGDAPVITSVEPRAGRIQAASSQVTEPRILAAAADQTAPADRIMLTDSSRPVAPGMDLRSLSWLDKGGFISARELTVDLSQGNAPLVANSGPVASVGTVREQLSKTRAVAGVNGDFFDINNSGASLGAMVQNGTVMKGSPIRSGHVGLTSEGLVTLASAFLSGTVTTDAGATIPVMGLNQHAWDDSGVAVFNATWGSYSRKLLVGKATAVTEVTVVDGVVTKVATEAGEGQPAANETILLGKNAMAAPLAALQVGQKVTVEYALRDADQPNVTFKELVGGGDFLVRRGQTVNVNDATLAPRTAVGISQDGKKMTLFTVDGRMASSRGMTRNEVGAYLLSRGAYDVINLDGGGSTTMVARRIGEKELRVENVPSDGSERLDSNSLGIATKEGSGKLTGIRLTATAGPENPDFDRVFVNTTRTIAAVGYDETYGPATVEPTLAITGGQGTVTAEGAVRPTASGQITLTATSGAITASKKLTVLGALQSLRPNIAKVSLLTTEETATVRLIGRDAKGFEAPVEASDVELSYDQAKLNVQVTPEGALAISSKPGAQDGDVITLKVGDVTGYLPVAIGAVSTSLADFSKIDGWNFANARAAGSISPATGREGGPALHMDYDFTMSTATRVAYARPNEAIVLPGQPLALGMWVNSDGKGTWTSFGIKDANGKSISLYGPYLTKPGWQYVEVPVPQSVPTPITLKFIGAIETKATASYKGAMDIEGLVVKSAPVVNAPAAPRDQDPVVAQHHGVDAEGEEWNFAVMSDGQFTAANQSLVPAVRRTLQEIAAKKPAFVIINGDLVDTGYQADFDLAKQVLDEELTSKGIEWHYNMGNHEVYGTNTNDLFSQNFGSPYSTWDHKGTRFVRLNSSTSMLRTSNFDQIQMLKDAIEGAKKDPNINGVVVSWHHPPRDPSPVKNSQMNDAYEVAMVEGWLADLRASGKGAAFIGGHVGSFSANTVDGVPYVINGNSGKTPSTEPADGGFSGWSLYRINPKAQLASAPEMFKENANELAKPWFEVEMRPHVDELKVSADRTDLTADQTATVNVDITQWEKTFPLSYPMTADWSGTDVFIGDPAKAPAEAKVAFDPVTRVARALHDGSATLQVRVNDKTANITFNVQGVDPTPTPTPTATPTATPTPKPTATPTPTPTPTPKPTPTPTPKPTEVKITRGTVSITGKPIVGSRLAAVAQGFGPAGVTYSYQWSRNGVVIGDAKASTYVVRPADLGKRLSVRVTVSLPGAKSIVQGSNQTIAASTTDHQAPSTGITITKLPSTAVITLNSRDLPLHQANMGVKTIYYRLDGKGAIQSTSKNPVAIVVGKGTHYITFWAVDHVGNTEAKRTVSQIVVR